MTASPRARHGRPPARRPPGRYGTGRDPIGRDRVVPPEEYRGETDVCTAPAPGPAGQRARRFRASRRAEPHRAPAA